MNVKDKVYTVIGKFGFDQDRYNQLLESNHLSDEEVMEFTKMIQLKEMAETAMADLGDYVNWQLGRISHMLEQSFSHPLPSEQSIPQHVTPSQPEAIGYTYPETMPLGLIMGKGVTR